MLDPCRNWGLDYGRAIALTQGRGNSIKPEPRLYILETSILLTGHE
jgi:hypothetical protein